MKKLSLKLVSVVLVLVMCLGVCTISFADSASILGGEYIITGEGNPQFNACSSETTRKNFDESPNDTDIKIASDGKNIWFDVYDSGSNDKTCGNIQWSNVAMVTGSRTGKVCYSVDFKLHKPIAGGYLISLDYMALNNYKDLRIGLIKGMNGTDGWAWVQLKKAVKNVADATADVYEDFATIKTENWYRYSVILELTNGVPQYATAYIEALDDGCLYLRNTKQNVCGVAAKSSRLDLSNAVSEKSTVKSIHVMLTNAVNYYQNLSSTGVDKVFSIDNLNISWVEDGKPVIYTRTKEDESGLYNNILPKDRKTDNLGVKTHLDRNVYESSDIHGVIKGKSNETATVYVAIVNSTTNELLAVYPQDITLDSNGYGTYVVKINDKTLMTDIVKNANYKVKVFNWNKDTIAPYNTPDSVLQ